MSWYRDPELFLGYQANGQMGLWRLGKKYGSPLTSGDFSQIRSNITDHLSLIDNSFRWSRSDFDALAAFIYRHDLLVNCQGLSLPITFPRDRANNNQPNTNRGVYFWSHEVVNLPRYGVPVHSVRFQEVRFMEGGGSAPVEPSPKENDLAARLTACINERDRERVEKHALENELEKAKAYKINLEKQVSDLTSELSGSSKPWMSGCEVPDTWVPFDELDVLNIPRKTPLTITKVSSLSNFSEDNMMTNVEANHFYQGKLTGHVVPFIVLVNFAELAPDNEKAKFDPNVWGLFTNGDIHYAARKLNG